MRESSSLKFQRQLWLFGFFYWKLWITLKQISCVYLLNINLFLCTFSSSLCENILQTIIGYFKILRNVFLTFLWCLNYPSSLRKCLPFLLLLPDIFHACRQTINRTLASLQSRMTSFVLSFSNCNIACTSLSFKRRYIGAEVMHEQMLLKTTK